MKCEDCNIVVLIDQTTVKCPRCKKTLYRIDDVVEAVMK